MSGEEELEILKILLDLAVQMAGRPEISHYTETISFQQKYLEYVKKKQKN